MSRIAVRVDVATARPPTPENTRPRWSVLALNVRADGSDLDRAEREAVATALALACADPRVVMPVAARIEWVEP